LALVAAPLFTARRVPGLQATATFGAAEAAYVGSGGLLVNVMNVTGQEFGIYLQVTESWLGGRGLLLLPQLC
jgi:hypothetical protein